MKEFDKELVSGSILRSVWKLSWPIVLLQLINGVNQLLGHVLVGRYVESPENAANAAIGVSWQFFLVIVVFVSSFIQGMSVLIARYVGKQDRENVGKVMYQTILAALTLHIFFLAPIGYFLTPKLAAFATDSQAVQDYAIPYMQFLFVFSAVMFLNFLLINAFQASGDSRTPLYLGIFGTVITTALTVGLITGWGPFPKLGVMGAAVGTCFGPLPSVLIAFGLIATGRTVFHVPRGVDLIPDFRIVGEVLKIGLPTGLQSVTLNVGGTLLMHFVGKSPDGASALAAYTLCYTQLFSFITWVSFGLRGASATLVGQNIGAGDTDRAQRAVHVVAGLGLIWALVFGVLYTITPEFFLGLFNANEGAVRDYGVVLLRYLAVSGLFLSAALAYTGGMQGGGDTISPMIIAMLTQIGVLVGSCWVLDIMGILTADKIWAAIFMSHFSRFALSFGAFRWGRWRRIQFGIEATD